jgi:hypothetical protein
VTNTGSDRSQLANVAREAKAVLQVDKLEAVADRGYFNGEEILACEQAGICVTLPKPMTSGAKSEGRFGKQDFVYMPEEDVYRCPAGEKLKFYYANEEHGQKLRRYWTNACKTCAIKDQCTTGKERRITRWEHEHVLEAVQQRLDQDPQAMRRRRETVEHPFGTLKMRMGATHFLMKTAEGCERDGAQRARLQSDARHEYRWYKGVAGSDQGVSVEAPLRADLESGLAQHSPRWLRDGPDRPTGKNCSDRPCRTTFAGSWTVANCISALSRNQDPNRT